MNNPEVLPPGAGASLWFLDTFMQVKLAGAVSGGALAVEVVFHGPSGALPDVRGT